MGIRIQPTCLLLQSLQQFPKFRPSPSFLFDLNVELVAGPAEPGPTATEPAGSTGTAAPARRTTTTTAPAKWPGLYPFKRPPFPPDRMAPL